MQSFDAIIVGAGVLGSALAATLSKQGRKVLLIGMRTKPLIANGIFEY